MKKLPKEPDSSSRDLTKTCRNFTPNNFLPNKKNESIKDDYVLETTPSDLIFIDTSAPSLDGLFIETTPASDTFFQTTLESDYLYIDTSPPSGTY